jgi:hypothetical protein
MNVVLFLHEHGGEVLNQVVYSLIPLGFKQHIVVVLVIEDLLGLVEGVLDAQQGTALSYDTTFDEFKGVE